MTALDARVVVRRAEFAVEAEVTLAAGEVVAVMGPSGAGKSTLLAALARPALADEQWVRRAGGVVLMRQDPRLFPHLRVRDNIAFGLRARGVPRAEAAAAATDWAARVGLAGLEQRLPAELSGGQQQRAALARALATRPAVLLLDEPLVSLDVETAAGMRALLRDQLTGTGTAALVATHDAVDAVALADRMLVLEAGAVTQSGPVREVLAAPATRFAAAVAGLNRVDGTVDDGAWRSGALRLPAPLGAPSGGLAAVFRPADVRLAPEPPSAAPARVVHWPARAVRLEPTPAGIRVRTAEPNVAVDVAADRAAGIAPGAEVTLALDPADVRFLPRPGAGGSG